MVASRALAVLCAADLLVTLDGMVVTVALPAIERDLGASRHELQWVVTAYTLTLGAFLLVGLSACAGGLLAPRIVERAGPRRTATASLVVTAAAFLFLARVPDHDGYAAFLLPAFLLAGFTFATAFVPLTSQGMTGVREGERGLASGLFQTSTHLGGAFVLTVLATAAAAPHGRSAGRWRAGRGGAHVRLRAGVPRRRGDPRAGRDQRGPDAAGARVTSFRRADPYALPLAVENQPSPRRRRRRGAGDPEGAGVLHGANRRPSAA